MPMTEVYSPQLLGHSDSGRYPLCEGGSPLYDVWQKDNCTKQYVPLLYEVVQLDLGQNVHARDLRS